MRNTKGNAPLSQASLLSPQEINGTASARRFYSGSCVEASSDTLLHVATHTKWFKLINNTQKQVAKL